MLLSKTTCYLAGVLLLSGLTSTVLANESLKQQPPLELPKTLNDLELPASADNAKSDPVKKAVKSVATVKSEVKGVQLPPAKPLPRPTTPNLQILTMPKKKPDPPPSKPSVPSQAG